jgi:hypothetical protein
VKAALLLLLAFALPACSASFEEARDARIMMAASAPPPARDAEHCRKIDARHELMVGAAWLDGSLAGASAAVGAGLSQVDDVPKGWPLGLGIGAAVMAGQAVYATVAASNAAAEYVRDCQ